MNFTVRKREIKCTDAKQPYNIGDNADYEAVFTFDAEWNGHIKTAKFVNGGKVARQILTDDKCIVPVEVLKKGFMKVGVYADAMTTTSCEVYIRESIKENTGVTAEPTPDVYAQIISMIEEIEVAGVTDERIEKVVLEYLAENPVSGVDEAEVQKIVAEYIEANKEDLKGEKGDKGDPGNDGKDGVDGLDGADGADGKSAYDIAVDNGFEGTEKEWLESLKGNDGAGSGYAPKWQDKSLGAFGTSITYLCGSDGGYLQTMKDTLGLASFTNYGLSGHAIAYVEGRTGISRKIQSTNTASFDIITIEGCTNDFKLNVPLGSVGKIGDTNFDDSADFCQALRKAIEHIFTEKPTANILLIADMQRDNSGYDVNHVNTAGHKLIDYVNAMVEIGALYGVPVCDLYRNSGFNALTLGTYTTDGLHPNDVGFARIGNVVSAVMDNMCSNTVIINGEIDNDDNNGEDNGGEEGGDTGEDTGSETPNNNVATIEGVDYDISAANGYAYKMIMLLSSKYYLHYSNSPFYIYDESTNAEVFQSDTYRSTNDGQSFPDGELLSSSNYGTDITDGNGYRRSTRNRALSNYVWTNADILYWGTENVAVASII